MTTTTTTTTETARIQQCIDLERRLLLALSDNDDLRNLATTPELWRCTCGHLRACGYCCGHCNDDS